MKTIRCYRFFWLVDTIVVNRRHVPTETCAGTLLSEDAQVIRELRVEDAAEPPW